MSLTDINIFTAAFPNVGVAIPPLPLAVAITSVLFLSLLFLQALREKLQRSAWSDLPKYNEIPSSTLRQRVTRKQLKELSGKIDVAVIGSGVGALSSAAMLAKAGYKVGVFEKHYVVGGSSQTFEHEGYEFDVGVHYVGGGTSIRRMFDYLSDGQLKWSKMDSTYDVCYNAETKQRIEYTDNPEVNRKNLLATFPDLTEDALDKYDKACIRARQTSWFLIGLKILPPIFVRIVWPILSRVYKRYALRPAMEIMAECGLPPEVIGALSYHWGDIGTTPGRTPMFIQAALDNHYKQGGYFPVGGSTSIAKTIAAAITRRGGYVYSLSPVDEILTAPTLFGGHKAVGVRIHGVDVMVKKCVVSDAGFRNTFGFERAKEQAKPPLVNSKASAFQRSLLYGPGEELATLGPSYVSLYVGLDVTDAECGIPARNVWHLPNWKHDQNWAAMIAADSYEEVGEKVPFLFISNESAKDPEYATRHPGKATLEVFAPAKYEWFEQWQHEPTKKRSSDYEKIKDGISKYLLKALEFHFPQIKGHIAFIEVGTPLTVDHYLGRQKGEVYNLDHTIDRFNSAKVQRGLHPQTTVKNLYLAGQDAMCVSVVGSTMSGLIVAARVGILGFLHAVPYLIPLLEIFM